MNEETKRLAIELAKKIEQSNKIVFFGGAGVSTASNIPDFRSSNGLFNKKINRHFTPEELVSHTFYIRHKEDFFEFYKDNFIYLDAQPNGCHRVLAKLEKMGKLSAVVTQNIDGLHQLAGSQKVYELHGSVHRNYCMKCGKLFDAVYIVNSEKVPVCNNCGGDVKPDVVLYEEGLDDEIVTGAINTIADADMLIIGGTSLVVYPAASLIRYFSGNNLVLVNKSVTSADSNADIAIHDDIEEVFLFIAEYLGI